MAGSVLAAHPWRALWCPVKQDEVERLGGGPPQALVPTGPHVWVHMVLVQAEETQSFAAFLVQRPTSGGRVATERVTGAANMAAFSCRKRLLLMLTSIIDEKEGLIFLHSICWCICQPSHCEDSFELANLFLSWTRVNDIS